MNPTPVNPSRFHASPAEIDTFLREHFAEDVLLNFYRAAGDEVLDEIITSGKTFKGLKARAEAKHVYLSGIDDVLAYIYDDRYFPARPPQMATYDRPFNTSREPQRVQAYVREVPGGWIALRDNDRSQVMAEAVLYDDLERKLAALPYLVIVMDPNHDPVPAADTFDDLLDESSLGSPRVQAARASGELPEDVRRRVAETVAAPEPKGRRCYIPKSHPPHDWMFQRKVIPCPGGPKGS